MGLGWWWLSFVDTERPEGQRFLGVVVLEATGFMDAVGQAWAHGLNPGGEVQGMEVVEGNGLPPEAFRNRLLSEAEAMEVGQRGCQGHEEVACPECSKELARKPS